MVDDNAALLALRVRALTLVAVTTGSTTLSATATGYARAAGSFVTDGFAEGMEFLTTGFASNGYRVVAPGGVTALALTTTTAQTIEAPGAGRTLTAGIPEGRAFDNRRFTPVPGRPYIEEDYVPGGSSLQGSKGGGYVYEDGLYIIKWYGLEDRGSGSIRKPVNALKALFAPGTAIVAGAHILRIRGDTAVKSGQILPQGTGWAVCPVTIPWLVESINAVV